MATLEQILAKLDRPPAAHNFARSNYPAQSRTTSALVNLALGFPIVSYEWATRVITITIVDQRTDEEAIAILSKICPQSQFEANLELLNAFLSYHATRRFEGFEVYPEWGGWLQAGPNVSVPVRPTVIIRENGKLVPLFIVGWATNPLSYYQYRLLTYMQEDAVYSLTDFRDSPGETLFFSRNGFGMRSAFSMKRGSFMPLSQAEVVEQVERFIRARDSARPLIAERYAARAAKKATESPRKGSAPDAKRPPL